MESLSLKATGTVHKHGTQGDKVVSHGSTDWQFWDHYTCILELNN